MVKQKKVFTSVIITFCFILMVLPFTVTLNDALTKLVERNSLYGWLQKSVVPIEAKMMGVIIQPFGYKYAYSPTNSMVVVNGVNMQITWNCLGWQSLLLLFVSFLIGFGSKYKFLSILTAIGVGILGTFWLNILRMLLTVVLAASAPSIFRIVFHDYLAAITTVIWLFFFWWFSYKHILETKEI